MACPNVYCLKTEKDGCLTNAALSDTSSSGKFIGLIKLMSYFKKGGIQWTVRKQGRQLCLSAKQIPIMGCLVCPLYLERRVRKTFFTCFLYRALPSFVRMHKTWQSGINFKPVGFNQGVEVVFTGSIAMEMYKTWRLEV